MNKTIGTTICVGIIGITGTIGFIIGKQIGKNKEKKRNDEIHEKFIKLYGKFKDGAVEEQKFYDELIELEKTHDIPNENYIKQLEDTKWFWQHTEREYTSTIDTAKFYFTHNE